MSNMEPDIKKIRMENDTPSKGWFDLPYDIRYIIIGLMDNPTKVTYLLCSEDCAREIRQNLFKWVDYANNTLRIGFVNEEKSSECSIYFEYTARGIMVENRSTDLKVLWKNKESGNIYRVIARYFQRIIENATYLDELSIFGAFPFGATCVKHLRSLKELRIVAYDSRPLDMFFETGFIDPEQIYNIPDRFQVGNVPLTMFQLTQIKSQLIRYISLEVSSGFIKDYLKFFVDGQIHENVQYVTFEVPDRRDMRLDMSEVSSGLEISRERDCHKRFAFSVETKEDNCRIGFVKYFDEIFEMTIYPKKDREIKF